MLTLWAAVIAACAALGGLGYSVLHDKRTAEEQKRGAARLMQQEFLTRYCDVKSTLDRGRYPKATIALATQVPSENRLQVAAAMEREDWEKVAVAYGFVRRAERALARPAKAQNDGRVPLTGEDKDSLDTYAGQFKAAFTALTDPASTFGDDEALAVCDS